jgi:hypothetical protein
VGELDDDGFRGLRNQRRKGENQRRERRNNQRLEHVYPHGK